MNNACARVIAHVKAPSRNLGKISLHELREGRSRCPRSIPFRLAAAGQFYCLHFIRREMQLRVFKQGQTDFMASHTIKSFSLPVCVLRCALRWEDLP